MIAQESESFFGGHIMTDPMVMLLRLVALQRPLYEAAQKTARGMKLSAVEATEVERACSALEVFEEQLEREAASRSLGGIPKN